MRIKDEVSSFLHHLVDIDKMGSRTHQLEKKFLGGNFLRVKNF